MHDENRLADEDVAPILSSDDEEETELFARGLMSVNVMTLMSTLNLSDVGVRCFVPDGIPLMNESVVNDEIDHAVDGDAKADVEVHRRRRVVADVDHGDGHRGEPDAEDIVQFEAGVNRSIVMRLMDEPERPVKDVFVQEPREDFHADDGEQNSRDMM